MYAMDRVGIESVKLAEANHRMGSALAATKPQPSQQQRIYGADYYRILKIGDTSKYGIFKRR
jgi:hypothetical protein